MKARLYTISTLLVIPVLALIILIEALPTAAESQLTSFDASDSSPAMRSAVTYLDDFSGYTLGLPPTGWLLRGTSSITPTIEEIDGTGPAYRLVSFPEIPWQYTDKWLLKDSLVLSSSYTVTVKLNFQNGVADRAGLTIAWNDSNWNRIDVQPNVYWDDIEFRVTYNGPITPNTVVTNVGYIPIDAFTEYWLRVTATDYGPGHGQVIVYWSTDNISFRPVVTATGLAELTGLAGISTAGPHLPHTHFDDFILVTSDVPNVDMGFHPNPDGYQFSNYGGLYPLPPAINDYTTADMRRMFGDAVVCNMIGPVCVVKWAALRWNWEINRSMNGGHCYGMAITSLRFFKGMDNPSDFQVGASTTHDLQLGNSRRNIAYYFVEQATNPTMAYINQMRQNPPSVILNLLRSAMSGNAPDPMILIMWQAGQGGHAVTPYAIEDQGNGIYWVKVYDNNHSDDANRHVIINTNNETWSYDLGWATWSGMAVSHTLTIVPLSQHPEHPVCPWCGNGGSLNAVSAPSFGEIWFAGRAHLLITDSQGRRIGYVDNQFVNEVPGAYESNLIGGLGSQAEPIYHLPLTETYSILIDGQTLTQTEEVAVSQFGPDYAVAVDDVTLTQLSRDRLQVAPGGNQLAYHSSDTKSTTLTLALDGLSYSDQFQIKNASIGANQTVTVTNDAVSGTLKFDDSHASGGKYDLEIKRTSVAGEQRFVYAGIVISATDTHYMDYELSTGLTMTLRIDHGSEGTIDETVILKNQARQIYLPLVLRSQ